MDDHATPMGYTSYTGHSSLPKNREFRSVEIAVQWGSPAKLKRSTLST